MKKERTKPVEEVEPTKSTREKVPTKKMNNMRSKKNPAKTTSAKRAPVNKVPVKSGVKTTVKPPQSVHGDKCFCRKLAARSFQDLGFPSHWRSLNTHERGRPWSRSSGFPCLDHWQNGYTLSALHLISSVTRNAFRRRSLDHVRGVEDATGHRTSLSEMWLQQNSGNWLLYGTEFSVHRQQTRKSTAADPHSENSISTSLNVMKMWGAVLSLNCGIIVNKV